MLPKQVSNFTGLSVDRNTVSNNECQSPNGIALRDAGQFTNDRTLTVRRTWMKNKCFGAILAIGLLGAAPSAQAHTFTFTSCHVSGGCGTATSFGTVTLAQSGANVLVDVELNSGNRFVETGAGGGELFLFNDTLSGSTITTIATSPNTPAGGLSGFTNLSPVMADGTGTFTASVECTVASDCNGGSAPTMNSLTFTVTNATQAQLLTANADGNIFVADILCGQPGCGGLTGPIDVESISASEPSTLLLLGSGLCAVAVGKRKKFIHGASRA
jgi:hypothetical protein